MDSSIDIEKEFRDVNGKFRTQSLFEEYKNPSYTAPFNLTKHDKPDSISLYKIYMEESDPTEYSFALRTFGSWEHWALLSSEETGPEWFMVHLRKWRKELKAKLASEHYHRMDQVAQYGKTATERMMAVRWLSSELKPAGAGKGRPTKAAVEGRLKSELRELDEVNQDKERLGL